MNFLSLKYFVELVIDLNMTSTAQKLYISQQNLTQHIHRLEEFYGVKLFNRKPKLSLTYAGELLYESAKKILEEENSLINKFSDISAKGVGKLRLGIPSYRAQISLPPILQKFYKEWPNITIEMTDQNSEKLEQMLFTNELDLFIGIMPQDDQRLKIIPLLYDQIFLVASDSLLKKYYGDSFAKLKARDQEALDIKNFSKLPLLLPKAPSRLRNSIDTCLRVANVKPKIFFEAMTTDLLLALYPYSYGAFFCTHMRLGMLKNMFSGVNAFPISSEGELMQHRLVLAHHRNKLIFSYLTDFINITKIVYKKIEENRD
jgi:DNA-binding transcriptional LysR family regulator